MNKYLAFAICLLMQNFVWSQTTYPQEIVLHGDTLVILNKTSHDSLISKLALKDFFIRETIILAKMKDSLEVKSKSQQEALDLRRKQADSNSVLIEKQNLQILSYKYQSEEWQHLHEKSVAANRFWKTVSLVLGGVLTYQLLSR